MARIVEMINLTGMVVPVLLTSGVTVYVPPRGKVEDADISNLGQYRGSFKIIEPLNEAPVVPNVGLRVPDVEVPTAPFVKTPEVKTKGKSKKG